MNGMSIEAQSRMLRILGYFAPFLEEVAREGFVQEGPGPQGLVYSVEYDQVTDMIVSSATWSVPKDEEAATYRALDAAFRVFELMGVTVDLIETEEMFQGVIIPVHVLTVKVSTPRPIG